MQSWTITISSPLGDTKARLEFEDTGKTLVGQMTGKGGDGPMENGRIDGDRLSWSCKIQKPAPMTLKFDGKRDGDAITGSVKFGIFASGSFSAHRTHETAPGD